ncbi:MAG: hypothetical protein ABI837_12200, partial [Acidobacteriota bacterium]
ETDGELLWPKKQLYPTEAEKRASLAHNPEGAATRGLWSNIDFLENVSLLNPQAKNTQFADYHGHGWNFMAVFKRDRAGNLLDADDKKVSFDDPQKFSKAVHLQDIHLEKGMHCADCHFSQDEHGNGQIYAEYANNIEIECSDCHGTVDRYTNLRTSGPQAPEGGTDLRLGTTPFGQRRFAWINGRLYQRSMLTPGVQWEVIQVKDSVTPGNEHYNERSAYAKTIQHDGTTWGGSDVLKRAHSDAKMTCYACHTSWMTSCSGCHLPQEQNQKTKMQHYEGLETRNYASYNPQVIRTDTFMLGVNGTTKGHRLAPVRSSSALVISSSNASRDHIYIQQPPISSPGYSSQAFNAHVPHTVRTRETQGCGSCHITKENDNNAWLAQVQLQGTNFVNFIGRYAYVAEGEEGFEAVGVTEWDEPQAVIGSSLHQIVYPDYYAQHQQRKMELEIAHEHHGDARTIQMRGEYVFTANGEKGFEVYDIANVDNKDFSERISSAPVSPLGQRTYVKTKFASAVALPTTMPMAPERKTQFIPENEEQPIHPLYRYAYIADREEGLVLVDVTTLTDGNPSNNFFKRALTFNPDGALNGAQSITVAGRWVFMGTEKGLQILDIDKPLEPRIIATLPELEKASSIAVQFRYAFVTDSHGLHSVDITDPSKPRIVGMVEIPDARSVYAARTYAYVAAGAGGMVIVDIERAEKPSIYMRVTEHLEDTNDIKVASTNASTFAYVADGKGGFKIFQLTSPQWLPASAGFSPAPQPRLIAERHTHGPAMAISKGLDRDRAVDESGYQVSIFNRIGARPMTLAEMQRLYLRDGSVYTVEEKPSTAALPWPVDRSSQTPSTSLVSQSAPQTTGPAVDNLNRVGITKPGPRPKVTKPRTRPKAGTTPMKPTGR